MEADEVQVEGSSLPDSDEEMIKSRIDEEEKYLQTDDIDLKRQAEQAANRVLGLPELVEVSKNDDQVDKALKFFLKRRLEQGKQALMSAYIKHDIFKIWGRKFTSKGERETRRRMDELVDQGVIQKENEWITEMLFEKFDKTMFGLVPVVKLEPGKFMIGTEKKQVIVKNDTLIVRIGGGFESLDRHIDHIARNECLKITHTMRTKNMDYKETVVWYLDQIKASDKVKESYLKGKHCDIIAFKDTMNIYEKKAEYLEQRKKDKEAISKMAKGIMQKNLNPKDNKGSTIGKQRSFRSQSPESPQLKGKDSPPGKGKTSFAAGLQPKSPRGAKTKNQSPPMSPRQKK